MKNEEIEKRFIYVLYDPRKPDKYRYCGFTKNPERRLREHINNSYNSNKNIYKVKWIRSLLNENVKPKIKIIREYNCTINYISDREKYYYKKFIKAGHKLTNTATPGFGGDTYTNHPNKREIYEKMCKSNRNITQDRIEKLKLKCGHPQTKETKQKISIANSGNKNGMYGKSHVLSIKSKQKISIANSGNKNGMYGKKLHNILLEKYGQELANIKYLNKFKKLCKPIYQYDLNYNFIREYNSIKEASNISGIKYSAIVGNLRGNSKTSGNYIWKYK